MKKQENIDLYQYEHELEKGGIQYIGGVDEVGRGPLIGPVVAACCVLPADFHLEGLTDSKKLSEKKREKFYDYIKEHALAYGIGEVSPERIEACFNVNGNVDVNKLEQLGFTLVPDLEDIA